MKNAIVAIGELPPDDDGPVEEMLGVECDDGGAWSPKEKAALTPAKAARRPHRAKAPPTNAQMTEWSQNPTNNARRRRTRIPQQMGNGLGVPRGDQPRDVIPGPSAGDSLVAGNIDLPEDVANNEFDDHLVDVEGTRRPKQTDSSCLATRPRKRKQPLAADIQDTGVQSRACRPLGF